MICIGWPSTCSRRCPKTRSAAPFANATLNDATAAPESDPGDRLRGEVVTVGGVAGNAEKEGPIPHAAAVVGQRGDLGLARAAQLGVGCPVGPDHVPQHPVVGMVALQIGIEQEHRHPRPVQAGDDLDGGGVRAIGAEHPAHAGGVSGLILATGNIGGFAGPLLFGIVAEHVGYSTPEHRAAIERLGYTAEQFAGAYSVAVRVTPTKLRAW